MVISLYALEAIFALLVVLAGVLLYRASRSPDYQFNLEDLLLDQKTGKASLSKVGQFTALCTSTWGFCYLTVSGALTEAYMTVYMAAWAGTSLAHKWIDKKKDEQ